MSDALRLEPVMHFESDVASRAFGPQFAASAKVHDTL